MKKRLEAELISIAHRILKLKNKSELNQLYFETQKLYETLSVLRFVEQNLEIIQPKIDVAEIESKLEMAFDKNQTALQQSQPQVSETVFDQVNQETEPELKEDFEKQTTLSNPEDAVLEPIIPETAETFVPAFELQKDEVVENELEIENKPEPKQISFEDLLGHQYNEPVFEKVSDKKAESEIISKTKTSQIEEGTLTDHKIIEVSKSENQESKANPIEKSTTGISFGLNDRIGFEKNLFDGSSEDMNRVISQLSTFNSIQEAKDFIADMVKPDYNDWKGKEDYEERFMEIVAQKFS